MKTIRSIKSLTAVMVSAFMILNVGSLDSFANAGNDTGLDASGGGTYTVDSIEVSSDSRAIGVSAGNGSTVVIGENGDGGITVTDSSDTFTVGLGFFGDSDVSLENGDITVESNGFAVGVYVEADDYDNITLDVKNGDIVVTGDPSTGIAVDLGSGNDGSSLSFFVNGDVTAYTGIYFKESSEDGDGVRTNTIAVTGNVTATEIGLDLALRDDNDEVVNDIFVGGTLSGDEKAVDISTDGKKKMPTLTTWALESSSGQLVDYTIYDVNHTSGIKETEKAKQFLENVNYIVKTNGCTVDTNGLTKKIVNGTAYYSAKAGQNVNFKVEAKDGEELEGIYYTDGEEASLRSLSSLKKNTEGFYVIEMLDGGRMKLAGKWKVLIKPESPKSDKVVTDTFVIDTFVKENQKEIDLIKTFKDGDTISINAGSYTGIWNEVLLELLNKNDISVVITYNDGTKDRTIILDIEKIKKALANNPELKELISKTPILQFSWLLEILELV